MVEFVQPLGVDSVAARGVRMQHAHIVEIAFGNDPRLSLQCRCLFMKSVSKFRQDMADGEVEDSVDGVQTQPVNVILSQPIERIVYNESPHSIATRAVVVDSASPGRPVLVGE